MGKAAVSGRAVLLVLLLHLIHHSPALLTGGTTSWGTLPPHCEVLAVTDPNGAAGEEVGCWVDGCNNPWGGGGCPNPVVRALVTPEVPAPARRKSAFSLRASVSVSVTVIPARCPDQVEAASQAASAASTQIKTGRCSQDSNAVSCEGDPSAMTRTGCLGFCAAGGFTYAGMEGGYICYCGNSLPWDTNVNLSPTKQSECLVHGGADAHACLSTHNCGTPCFGEPSVFCGGAPYRMEVVRLKCGGEAGWLFVALLAIATASYGGGGAVLGSRAAGAPRASLQHHPHRTQWVHLHSLVQDGVAFSRARFKGSRLKGGGDPLLRRAEAGHSRSTTAAAAAAAAAAADRGNDGRKLSGSRRERSKTPQCSVSGNNSSVATTQSQQPQEAAGRGLLAEEREAVGGLHSSQAKVRVVALSVAR